jgi:hypothetical protein
MLFVYDNIFFEFFQILKIKHFGMIFYGIRDISLLLQVNNLTNFLELDHLFLSVTQILDINPLSLRQLR